jgi:hypothetical protein
VVPTSSLSGDPWAAFERLPPAIRHALQYTVLDICPKVIAEQVRSILRLARQDPDAVIELHRAGFGDRGTVARSSIEQMAVELYVDLAFRSAEQGEIQLLGVYYRHKHGTELPHLAAGASVLHDTPVSRRHRRAPAPPPRLLRRKRRRFS